MSVVLSLNYMLMLCCSNSTICSKCHTHTLDRIRLKSRTRTAYGNFTCLRLRSEG